MNFLVVDDSPLLNRVLVAYLNSMGHSCHALTNPEQAEAWLILNPCDAVILDIVMPEMDGITLISIIRKRFPKLPILMFTGLGFDEETMKAARDAGANGYVSKGLGPSDIYLALMRVLKVPAPPSSKPK
jgi:DNA-binding response OmpR family regulator